jgi:hypothetical protein
MASPAAAGPDRKTRQRERQRDGAVDDEVRSRYQTITVLDTPSGWETASSFWDVVRTYSVVFPELRLVRCAGLGNSLVMAWPVKAG